jgi:hypothetical protein
MGTAEQQRILGVLRMHMCMHAAPCIPAQHVNHPFLHSAYDYLSQKKHQKLTCVPAQQLLAAVALLPAQRQVTGRRTVMQAAAASLDRL